MASALHRTTRREREDLCDTLLALGPDAPTLCEGWTVLDLAAHLVVRERRPDAAPGLVVTALLPRLERLQAQEAARGLPAVVERFRQGPPPWSPFTLPGVEGLANLGELVVHHEDARRASGAGPRPATAAYAELEEAVWRHLPALSTPATVRLRVPLVAVRPDGPRRVLRHGANPVVLTGAPVELLLLLFGRRGAAQVDVSGPSLQVQRLADSDLGV